MEVYDSANSIVVEPNLEPRHSLWTIWRGTPWNPSCGKISLESGAKIFLGFYMAQMLILAAVGGFMFFPITWFIQSNRAQMCGAYYSFCPSYNSTTDLAVKEKTYERILNNWDIPKMLVLIAWMLIAARLFDKCRQAFAQGCLPRMKTYFWIVCCIIMVNTMTCFVVDHVIYSPLYVETPVGILSLLGIVFVYNYILEKTLHDSSLISCKFEPGPEKLIIP